MYRIRIRVLSRYPDDDAAPDDDVAPDEEDEVARSISSLYTSGSSRNRSADSRAPCLKMVKAVSTAVSVLIWREPRCRIANVYLRR